MTEDSHYIEHLELMVSLLRELEPLPIIDHDTFAKLIKKYALPKGGLFSKTDVILAYKDLAGQKGLQPYSEAFVKKMMMKPVRTVSGVAPVTVLTKPFPCPGQCIFCPNDVRMPKSYLSDEPGAQRAERNYFDPYLQTYNRLQALHDMGHNTDKVELIILGGTWSFYPEPYQIWFIKECFRALNDFGGGKNHPKNDDRARVREVYDKKTAFLVDQEQEVLTDSPEANKTKFAEYQPDGEQLKKRYNQLISELYVAPEKKLGLDEFQQASWEELEIQQKTNETAQVRSVGLVIETRPDNISEAEVLRIRRLGCTKTQIGVQSLQDNVLQKNHRGHDVAASKKAFSLLRQAGFKIHAHWMANLYGSDVKKDKRDYDQLFSDPAFHPDELKIYPCSLIDSAELMQFYKKGVWKPYDQTELLEVLSHVLMTTPPYCRLTRVIRDIPSPDIVAGNKKTNFRQIAEQHLEKRGEQSQDIRAREIRGEKFDPAQAKLEVISYETETSNEEFLQFVVPTEKGEKLLAFLRLSLPKQGSFISELEGAAMIREIHVYGRLMQIGKKNQQRGKHAQHFGFGTQLIEEAKKRAVAKKYQKLAVISAIGTKEYYRKKGFSDGELYQLMDL